MMEVSRRVCVTALLVCSAPALAATNVAIIDSGVDYKHKDLAALMWVNPGNLQGDTYTGDTNGWNFADNNNQVIDYSFLGTFPQDDFKFFDVQGRILLGTATPDDQAFYNAKKADQTFIGGLETFGNFVHGTHVSGITTNANSTPRIIALKLIATKAPNTLAQFLKAGLQGRPLDDGLIPYYLDYAAQQQADMLTNTSKYANMAGARVANGSFGTSVAAAEPAVAGVLKQLLGRDPTPDETQKWTLYLINDILKDCTEFVQAAPNTLFVFAAGNDGTDNDSQPTSPANLKADNTIAVAATLSVTKLASFSNYGVAMVEVAAPGVVIKSTIPGDQYMELSGTSMAAPYVTNAAAAVADANPSLKPADVKKVLMTTVDVKDFLKGKVSTSGIVNHGRAVAAARLSREMPLDSAITQARAVIGDQVDTTTFGDDAQIWPVPLPNPFQ